jgi:hypothetical protein
MHPHLSKKRIEHRRFASASVTLRQRGAYVDELMQIDMLCMPYSSPLPKQPLWSVLASPPATESAAQQYRTCLGKVVCVAAPGDHAVQHT